MNKTKMMKKNYEFRSILAKGKYYSGQYIEAFIRKNKLNINFLGIAISVKIAKAVKRNHLKRLIRESYYQCEKAISTGYSVVFLWKKKVDIKKATFKNIENDMKDIFKNANIIEENI